MECKRKVIEKMKSLGLIEESFNKQIMRLAKLLNLTVEQATVFYEAGMKEVLKHE